MEDMRQTLHVHSSMLQSLLRAQIISGSGSAELPDGVQFPLHTFDDVDNLEARVTDVSLRSAIIQILVDNGGIDIRDFVRRNMKFLIGSDIARQYNLTGQRGKRCFQSPSLYQLLYAAVKLNSSTKETSKKVLEQELANWFGNSRQGRRW